MWPRLFSDLERLNQSRPDRLTQVWPNVTCKPSVVILIAVIFPAGPRPWCRDDAARWMRCLHWSRSRNVGMSPQSTSITRPQPLDTLQLLIKTAFYKRSAIVDSVDNNENLPGDIFIFIAFCLDNLWGFGYFQRQCAFKYLIIKNGIHEMLIINIDACEAAMS